jgi:L-asparaginase
MYTFKMICQNKIFGAIKSIHVILTGGTIDSFYDATKDTVVPRKHSIVEPYLDSLKTPFKFQYTEICMKDSRQLNINDLKEIQKTADKSPHKNILITHGTYTMPDTGKYLKSNMKSKDKCVILTGSMIPLGGFTKSDSGFNLGYAVAKFDQLENGVYVCLNGQIFNPDEVMKMLSQGKFMSIFGESKE